MKPPLTTGVKRSTYNVIRKAIERDLVRDLGDRKPPLGLRAVRSPTLPIQDDLTVINRDEPAGVYISAALSPHCASRKVKNARPRGVGGKTAERLLAHTLTFSARPRRHRQSQRRAQLKRRPHPALQLEW